MPKRHSLRAADFNDLFSTGSRARVDGVTVYVRRRADSEQARLGLAVPKRSGNAVTRNRIRRRLRAAFTESGAPPGLDVAIKSGSEVAGTNFQELVNNLHEAVTAAEKGT
jgi:ribonuclease P protein component